MSIVDSRHDRKLASDRIDYAKTSIARLREHIDLVFQAHQGMPIQIQRQLAEIDYHLEHAAIELGAAQARILAL